MPGYLLIPGDAWDERGNPRGTSFSDAVEGEDPSRPSGAIDGEDVPDPACNLAHGQTLDLEQGNRLELAGCARARNRRERRTHRVEVLKLRDRQDEGGVAGELLSQSGPQLRLANRSGPVLCLGIQACRRL